jgi:rhodanese-related sulfurtransferase
MASLLLYRAAALITLGVIAGGIHAVVREKPVSLELMAPAPLPKPKGAEAGPVGAEPVEKPVTGTTASGAGQEPAVTPVNPVTPTPPADTAAADPLNVTLALAKELHEQGYVFLDARPLNEYEQGHIAGAFWLNTETFATPGGGEVLAMLDREMPIVVYCQGGMCDASKNLVRMLQQAGYMGGRIFHDGYPAWEKAGYPTAAGKPPIGGG